MTLAQAQAVGSALIGLGYDAAALQTSPGAWQVTSKAPANVTRAAIDNFAAAQGANPAAIVVVSHAVSTAVTFG